jgi:hypothetical protein
MDDNTDSGFSWGLLLTETAGSWATGIQPALPADAASAASQQVSLGAVSCPSAGNCAAVGSYESSAGLRGLIVAETGGSWRRGVKPTLPSNAGTHPAGALSSVSCVSAGNCTAVGSYFDNTSLTEGLLLTETAGAWGTGVEAILPANAQKSSSAAFAGLSYLSSVSCASAGNCSAVGTYADTSNTTQGLLLNETGSHWAAGIEAALPANARHTPNGTVANLNSISCPSAGNCDAVGNYVDNSGAAVLRGLLVNETAGSWATGVEANLPSNAAGTHYAYLNSVSCAGVGNCNAGGTYKDSASNFQALHMGTIPPLFTLHISKNGTGTGTVTSSPAGISCGSTCSHSYPSGTQVTLTAKAAVGSTFAGWSGSGCSGTGTCKVKMSAAKSVTATFK